MMVWRKNIWTPVSHSLDCSFKLAYLRSLRACWQINWKQKRRANAEGAAVEEKKRGVWWRSRRRRIVSPAPGNSVSFLLSPPVDPQPPHPHPKTTDLTSSLMSIWEKNPQSRKFEMYFLFIFAINFQRKVCCATNRNHECTLTLLLHGWIQRQEVNSSPQTSRRTLTIILPGWKWIVVKRKPPRYNILYNIYDILYDISSLQQLITMFLLLHIPISSTWAAWCRQCTYSQQQSPPTFTNYQPNLTTPLAPPTNLVFFFFSFFEDSNFSPAFLSPSTLWFCNVALIEFNRVLLRGVTMMMMMTMMMLKVVVAMVTMMLMILKLCWKQQQ